jgi:hypothetical protein
MLRRWIIRTPFLLALTCIVAMWTMSDFEVFILHSVYGGRHIYFGGINGLLNIGEIGSTGFPNLTMGAYTNPDWPIPHTIGGFYGGSVSGMPDSLELVIPFWLPTIVLAMVCWFVWSKTRPKKMGRAFPVQLARAEMSVGIRGTENRGNDLTSHPIKN